MHYIIGIDEAGRGPWAGPLVVGGWLCTIEKYEENIASMSGLTDSKKLRETQREKLLRDIQGLQEKNLCQYAFAYRDAHEIDIYGIRQSNKLCMQDTLISLLQYISPEDTVDIYVDGSDNYIFEDISASYTFAQKKNQKKKKESSELKKQIHIHYIINGDAIVPAISAGSIVAKVLRDTMMCEFHENFPHYAFHIHKGYGTKKHQEALKNYGISPIHRKSYAPVKKLIF